MRIIMKRSVGIVLSLVLCLSMVFGINFTVNAATVDYVKDGSYIYNWGVREEVATFLSPNAEAFYSKNNTTYTQLASLAGSINVNSVSSSALYKGLYNIMSSNHKTKTSYDGTRDLYKYTDCENNNKTKLSLFYCGETVSSTWDSGRTYNREHTWPNSKSNSGSEYTKRETDIIMLRPTNPSYNSSRGNDAYGESSGYFHPNKFAGTTYDVRGDVARAILYVYVRWGGDSSNNDGLFNYMWGKSGVIESKEVLLKWMQEDPVDTWEMGRNDSTESITGTRNIFIDYPELAFILFGEQVPSDYTTPSGNAKNGTSSTPNNNQNNNQSNTSSNSQTGTTNNNQNNTSSSSQSGSQNTTSTPSNNTTGNTTSTPANTSCKHKNTQTVAAEEPRCDMEGYTEGRYCNDCKTYISGHELIEATGHVYTADCDADCDVCGAERATPTDHIYEDGVCTICGTSESAAEEDPSETIGAASDDNDEIINDDESGSIFDFWWVVPIVIVLAAGVVLLVIYREKIWPKTTE